MLETEWQDERTWKSALSPCHPVQRHYYSQGRIIQCAGCTMKGNPRRKGAPADQLPNFYHAVLTFVRSVYALTLKRRNDD